MRDRTPSGSKVDGLKDADEGTSVCLDVQRWGRRCTLVQIEQRDN
jgi:hypothetical protein